MQINGISDYNLDNETEFNLYVWDDGVMHEFLGPFTPEKLQKVISFRKTGEVLWLEKTEYLKLDIDNDQDPDINDLK